MQREDLTGCHATRHDERGLEKGSVVSGLPLRHAGEQRCEESRGAKALSAAVVPQASEC